MLQGFEWFLYQSLTVGGLAPWFPIVVLLLLVALFLMLRTVQVDKRKLWVLLIFPALWILTALAGSSDPFTFKPNPSVWSLRFLEINQIVFLILGLISIFYFKGARFFVTIFFIVNLYFMAAMTALSTMGVTGAWI